MIIDFHTHMFPDKIAKQTIDKLSECSGKAPDTDGTYEGLLNSAKDAGINCSVVLPIATKPSQFRTINKFASRYLEGEIISFGSVHPEPDDYKAKLREIKNMGLKGIKLHPDYQDMYFNDIRYKRVVSYAVELGMIISVHAGLDPKCPDDIHCTPRMAAELIDDVRPEKLVLAHLGGNQQWDEVERYLVGKNVYFDTGVIFDHIEKEQFIRIMRSHGSDKILFGTDSPWAGQKKFVDVMKEMDITEEERDRVMGENGRRLLGI
ncbi:MAG: amidohydrolase family protein [Dorea sp.]|nr:amidohydrolase family protein [Dorea sp.]